MPPHAPKKAAKKAAKKTAKKAAKKAPSHRAHHDLRRAYEHISRVRALHLGLQPVALAQVDVLSRLAQAAMSGDDAHSAADLLRAAEHVSFAYLSSSASEDTLSPALATAARAEYEHLIARAQEHHPGKTSSDLRTLYTSFLKQAAAALGQGLYHRALEFARAAEALTHVEPPKQRKLQPGESRTLLLR
jgi:hypothetical protein